jgi:VanZ family protein
VKRCSEKDGPQPGFRQGSGVRGQVSGIRGQVPGFRDQGPGIRLKKIHKFTVYWFPILVYCLLIYIQSSHPSPQSLPDWPFIDKLLHFACYAFLGALFVRAFNTTPIKHNLKLVVILSVLLSSLYGISDEIHQHFVPFRTADVMDALSDILGSIAGVYLYSKLTGSGFPVQRSRL